MKPTLSLVMCKNVQMCDNNVEPNHLKRPLLYQVRSYLGNLNPLISEDANTLQKCELFLPIVNITNNLLSSISAIVSIRP